jgi:hypothetical protein
MKPVALALFVLFAAIEASAQGAYGLWLTKKTSPGFRPGVITECNVYPGQIEIIRETAGIKGAKNIKSRTFVKYEFTGASFEENLLDAVHGELYEYDTNSADGSTAEYLGYLGKRKDPVVIKRVQRSLVKNLSTGAQVLAVFLDAHCPKD